ncbi:MAG: phosphoadenosine phosphosulfate reductase [Solirubrobacteraceae bacterium]|jgi:phosphoadenosine phosphosulfate reductase|nr:phosphoadenosine phosphosulfate reductase [Solirubrobacteraceae bacterium]
MSDVEALDDLEALGAEEILAHAVERFHPRLAVACSFQKEASVILDMLVKIEPETQFFTLDTGVLFPETMDTWRTVEKRYGIKVRAYRGMTLEAQAARHGDALWERDPDLCCSIRKVAPLNEALSGLDAWVSGLRRDQSPTRATTKKLAWDAKHDLWKLNPLADWSERDVWRYINEHDVPYHPLHDRGYASIGCTHCTAPSAGRDGRWNDREKIECGIHA